MDAPIINIYTIQESSKEARGAFYETSDVEGVSYIIPATLTRVAVCEKYTSLLWDKEYYESGNFELTLPASQENWSLFELDRIIGRSDDATDYGIVERIQVTADAESGDTLVVTGRFLSALLARRIIVPTATSSSGATLGEFVRDVLIKNGAHPRGGFTQDELSANTYDKQDEYLLDAVNMEEDVLSEDRYQEYKESYPTVTVQSRLFGGLFSCDASEFSDAWKTPIADLNKSGAMQVSYKNLMDWVYKMCKKVGGTLHVSLLHPDFSDDKSKSYSGCSFQIELNEGEDKSETIIFSDEYKNLSSIDYAEDSTEKVNAVLSLGAGTGDYRALMFLADESGKTTGWSRYEAKTEDADDTQEITDVSDYSTNGAVRIVYEKLKNAQGLAEAAQEAFTASAVLGEAEIVGADVQWTYKQDYNVGDLVSFRSERFGISIEKVRLTGMVESFSSNGYQLVPTFQFSDENEEADDEE